MAFSERIGIIPSLSSQNDLKPEMASLNSGSLNFGILSRKKNTFILDTIQQNPWSQLTKFADTMKKFGVKPESEIYEVGMINNVKTLKELGVIEDPLHFQFVLGVLGGMQSTVDNLVFLKNSIPSGSTWSVCSIGLGIFSIGAVAIACGGHVRVGLEDCLYSSKGKLANGNAELVSQIADISKMLGREIACPEDARKILNLSKNESKG
jgi:3-keto-5-aminohexanoate cleavage enzyme